MKKEKPFYENLGMLFVIFIILISYIAIIPSSSKSELQTNKPCIEQEGDSLMQQQSLEENIVDQFDCSSDLKEHLFTLFILGKLISMIYRCGFLEWKEDLSF